MKYFLLIIIIFIMSCHSMNGKPFEDNDSASLGTIKQTVTISDMKYVVFRSSSDGLFVINITKDSLEVQKLKQETLKP